LSDPALSADVRQALVANLMDARRTIQDAGDDAEAKAQAHHRVDAAKVDTGCGGFQRHGQQKRPGETAASFLISPSAPAITSVVKAESDASITSGRFIPALISTTDET
jgi:hypothetical protein